MKTKSGNVAVVIVKWQNLSPSILEFTRYKNWARDTQYVGYGLAIIADAIKSQIDSNMYMHCVGHSLGAHLCGFAGKYFHKLSNQNYALDRISGLDPAGPVFCEEYSYTVASISNCVAAQSRLSKTDAKIVDVIHTDGIRYAENNVDMEMSYGTMHDLGGVDFYVGRSSYYGCSQPSCNKITDRLGCSHSMAIKYFIESIKNTELMAINSKCENVTITLNNCTSLLDHVASKFSKMNHNVVPGTFMGYWLDSSVKGIYTVDVA